MLKELVKAIPVVGKPYIQRDELRAITNRLWAEPGNFNSPIPDVEAIRRDEALVFQTPRVLAGIELRETAQIELLRQLGAYADHPFTPNAVDANRYYFDNARFGYCDALVLQALIRHVRPARIVEVGCGFSSALMLDVNERYFAGRIHCTFIEPYPEVLHSLLRANDLPSATVRAVPVQQTARQDFAHLESGDILFIDSSHILKTASDLNWLLFEIIPTLRTGVYVHFHDIFYPFEYPKEWVYQGRAWNEAYAVRAFLQFNDQFDIVLFNSFLHELYPEALEAALPMARKYSQSSMVPTSAQSLWLRRV